MNKHMLDENTKLTVGERIKYGIGNGATSFAYIMYSSLIMYYFTDIFGIGAAAAGVLLLVARVWDGINDPMMGAIVDKTQTRFGKARPYIFVGGIILALFTVLLFTNPGFTGNGAKLFWAYFTYIGWGMAYTCFMMSLRVLPARLTKERNDYANMSAAGMIGATGFAIFATLFLMSIITYFSGTDGNMARGYTGTAVIAAILTLIATFVVSSVKERDYSAINGTAHNNSYSVLEGIKAVVSNKPFMGFAACSAIVYIGYYLSAATLMYYCIYNLGNVDTYTPLMVLDYGTPIITALTIPFIIKRVDKKNIIRIGLLFVAIAYGLRYITGDQNQFIMIILAGIAGLSIGYWNIMFTPVSIDCAIYSEYHTGKKMDGLFISSFTLLTKVASGIGGAILGFLLESVGYVEDAATQTEAVLTCLRLCATAGAAIASVIGLVVFHLTYKLSNEDLDHMAREIEKRNMPENENADIIPASE